MHRPLGRAAVADRLIADEVRRDGVKAVAFLMREDTFEFAQGYGLANVDTPFLITKPMTASAVLWLCEHKHLGLSERVGKYLMQFKGDGRVDVTLLTHTSRLPDMLPEYVELRSQHAPLAEFVARTCTTPLLFRPAERVSYQSMARQRSWRRSAGNRCPGSWPRGSLRRWA